MSDYYKHPSISHLPWSKSVQVDDTKVLTCKQLEGKDVVVTLKMDGESASVYRDYYHARSIDGRHHISRSWIKQFQQQIAHIIPQGWRICGENMYAKHSIHYHNLDTYFYVHSIWNEKNVCLAWKDIIDFCARYNLFHVPILYKGKWDSKLIKNLHEPFRDGDECEGYVVRITDEIPFDDYQNWVFKYVRAKHVQTKDNWLTQPVIKNELRKTGVK